MGASKTFNNVGQGIWNCVKTTSNKEHGTDYEPPDANQGTATTNTPVGAIVLGFNFDPSRQTVAYTIQKKPFVVSTDQIWNGIQGSINSCSGGLRTAVAEDAPIYNGITQEVFSCVKTKSEQEHGTKYDPPDANQGTATTSGSWGTIILGFNYDPSAQTLTYTLEKKPWLVPESTIWNGIRETIEECQGGG
jgi:hypothetical protein